MREGVPPPERVLESEFESGSVKGFIDPSPVSFDSGLNVISPEQSLRAQGGHLSPSDP